MITSYVSEAEGMLYLGLVGPLDRGSGRQLVLEYRVRADAGARRCVLDLTAADAVESDGLAFLRRLAARARRDGAAFRVVARGSPAQAEIEAAARQYRVAVGGPDLLPFYGGGSARRR